MRKKTDDLMNEILFTNNISQYITSNQEEFLDTPLHIYLKQLLADSGLSVSQVVNRANKGEYIYQVFRGIKNSSRDVLISIALAVSLSVEETSQLLRNARMPVLDPRNRRDSILIFALNHRLTVSDTNDVLYEFHETML